MKIDIKKILNTKGKKDEEDSMFFDRLYSLGTRKLADIGVGIVEKTSITPNQITITRAIIFLPIIFYFFAQGTYAGNILGVLFALINSLFDMIDGNLARSKKMTSEVGAWLDHNLDRLLVYIVYIAIILGSYKATDNVHFLIAGIIMLFLHAMIANVSSDYEKKYHEDIFFDSEVKDAVYKSKKTTFLDKLLVNMFIFNSFWSYVLFAARYQIMIGAILNIMPLMFYFWIPAFLIRLSLLCFVYYSLFTGQKSRFIFINELRGKLKPNVI